MRPVSLAVSLMLIVLFFCHLVLAKDKTLIVSITSVEQPDERKPSRVDAETVGHKPSRYYKLACGIGAENIEAGHLYKAIETQTEQARTLVLLDVRTAHGGILGVACDIDPAVK